MKVTQGIGAAYVYSYHSPNAAYDIMDLKIVVGPPIRLSFAMSEG